MPEAFSQLSKQPFIYKRVHFLSLTNLKFACAVEEARGLIMILRPPMRKLVDGKIAVVKRFYKISESLWPSILSASPYQVQSGDRATKS